MSGYVEPKAMADIRVSTNHEVTARFTREAADFFPSFDDSKLGIVSLKGARIIVIKGAPSGDYSGKHLPQRSHRRVYFSLLSPLRCMPTMRF